MEKVIILPALKKKISDLVTLLFDNGYFSMIENAQEYVDSITDFILTLPGKRKYPTKNNRYGAWYCEYKANKRTSWFVTFDTDEKTFLVKNIINNHTKDYPTFIRDTK